MATTQIPTPPIPASPPAGWQVSVLGLLPALLLLVLLPAAVGGQEPLEYRFAVTNAAHHEARITLSVPDAPAGRLEIRMSRSSPGRYALHEFAKNVYDVRVEDGRGRSLPVTRVDPHGWQVTVPEQGSDVVFAYTLYGDRVDGTYTAIDETHAHLNMPATFAWVRGWGDHPIRLVVEPPEGSEWTVATQLMETNEPYVFTAPDLYYFLDSPTEVSEHDTESWTAGEAEATIRVALHHAGTRAEMERYVEGVRRIVEEQRSIFGELPEFEGGRYTFLADYLPWASGDGMEHRNSTILTSSSSLAEGRLGLLGTVSHEFFHAWNVERIRPRTLEPFDFTRANMSRELWFAEGFTSYYDDLVLVRAGLLEADDYAARLGGTLNAVINAPGRRLRSPVEMSMQAPFVDAAVSVDPTNRPNTFLSYYTWGSAVALGLDLKLRTEHRGLTLDDYMRSVWERFGRTEVPYSVADLERVLADLTGDEGFARDFFRRYVRGSEVPDYATLLQGPGLVLRRARPDRAHLGRVRLRFGERGALVAGPTLVGSPLYQAGVDRGERITSIAGRTPDEEGVVEEVLGERSPGDEVELTVEGRGRARSVRVTLAPDPTLEVVSLEEAGRSATPAVERFRSAWLGSRVEGSGR